VTVLILGGQSPQSVDRVKDAAKVVAASLPEPDLGMVNFGTSAIVSA